MTRSIPAILIASLLAVSCAPSQDEVDETPSTPEATKSGEDAADESGPPKELVETAWRAISEEGARFTTYLDENGTYRDLRNGDPYQTGSWTYIEASRGKMLCFTPDDENGVETCWEPGTRDGETLIMTGPAGRRIELTSVEYIAPETEGNDGQ